MTLARRLLGPAKVVVRYASAEISRIFPNWFGSLSSPDRALQGKLRLIVQRSHDLLESNPIAVSMQRTWTSNIVGADGLRHFPQVKNARGKLNARVNTTLIEGWKDWGRFGSPTVDGRYSWIDTEELATNTEFGDGEFLALKIEGPAAGNRYGFGLQILDPAQLDVNYTLPMGPNGYPIRMGVELTAQNRPRGYWLWDQVPNDLLPTGRNRIFLPADRVYHYYEQLRPGQTRGIPRLSPIMQTIKARDTYDEAAIMASLLAANSALLFEQADGTEVVDTKNKPQGAIPVAWEPGMSKLLPPGVTAKLATPTHPGQNYESFVRVNDRKACAGVGMAYHSVTGDLSQSNYVSMRGGDLAQRDVFMAQQRRLATHFTERVYRDWLRNALLNNALDLPEVADWTKYAAVEFEGRGWDWTNPIQDITGASIELALGTTTRSAIARKQGLRLADIYAEREHDQELAKEYNLDLEDPLPSGVTESLSQASAAMTAGASDATKPGDETPSTPKETADAGK